MFKKRTNYSPKLKAMREAKEQIRLNGPAPDYPPALPHLRREIIVRDYDFGLVEHRILCYECGRIDCYRVELDGRPWLTKRVGWARLLREGLGKLFLRVKAT
ncbi:MAG: hypothetical protein C4560_03030 [Nitrospiraceae bacterium]|nr:MAG: hypothetical protein C4560_03030 [Nitrospiraceae bacterium]